MNLLTNMTDAVGATKFGYTDAGQLLSEDGPWASDTVTYEYDHRHRSRMSLAQPNASAWNQTYGFDVYGRLTNTVSGAGNFDYSYSYLGAISDRVASIVYPSSAVNYRYYDNFARLTTTEFYFGGGNPINSHAYSYNEANQRTQQVFTTQSNGDYKFMDYTYDKIGQLKTAKGTDYAYDEGVWDFVTRPRLNEQFGYSYDAAWNMERRTNNALVQTFGSNSRNELTNATRNGTLTVAGTAGIRKSQYTGDYYGVTGVTVNGNGLSSGPAEVYSDGTWARTNATLSNGANTYTAVAQDTYGRTSTDSVTTYLPATVTYQYDANGNLTNDGLRILEYDYENQLTNIYVTGQWRSESQYDGLGRRRVRKEYTWGGSAWVKTDEVRYVYDERLVIQERDANNLPRVSYTRGLDLSGSLQGAGGIGGLLARSQHSTPNSQHAFYHADGNGNVTMLVGTNGAVLARYHYDPYGNMLAMNGPLAEANTMRFSSKEFHQKSRLYYYLYRFYDPSLQRWVNRDPIEEKGGINVYTFVKNSSMSFYDPLGLAYICDRRLQNSALAKITPFIGKGYPGVHRQIFFEDYDKQKADPTKYPPNLGLFSDDKVKPDPVEKEDPALFNKYEKQSGNYKDDIMREAIDNVAKKNGTDWKKKRNCQDFVDEVTDEYFKLEDQRKQQPNPTAP